jgi:type 1 glutamine amidotransferase
LTETPTMLIVTQVAPYSAASSWGAGPAGVHGVLPQAAVALSELAALEGLEPRVVTDVRDVDAATFAAARVLALFTIGETPFSDDQRTAIVSAWRTGKLAVLGLHSATDASHAWGDYGRLLGARFAGHPWTQPFRIIVDDHEHPATAGLEDEWPWHDEVYLFRDLRPDARVLLHLTEDQLDLSVPEGRVPECGLPLAWCLGGASERSFYSALGHFPLAWERPDHLRYLAGGVHWLLHGDEAPEPVPG